MNCGETKSSCDAAGGQAADKRLKMFTEDEALVRRLSRIKRKILVLSGKGGVGKSTVAVNLAVALAMEGWKTGLLDVDFHGPSVPMLLNMKGELLKAGDRDGILPLESPYGVKVISLGFALGYADEAVIWRGPMKMGVIKQLLADVQWGELDYLVVDFPPGTGDEPLSVAQLIPDSDGAVIVTTPQDLSLQDVRKSINFCRQLKIPVLGVLENMSGLVCPHCGTVIEVFKSGGGETMARQMGVPFLGRIPMDPQIVGTSDEGKPFVYHTRQGESAEAFIRAIKPVLQLQEGREPLGKPGTQSAQPITEGNMKSLKIAVPTAAGSLCAHFGHCEQFALFDVDTDNKTILKTTMLVPPPHEPGLLPTWLQEQGADVIIAGGMGSRAQELFLGKGIRVVTGASQEVPAKVVADYLTCALKTGSNICDH
ncbi:MAG TPA: chromosome partitioning protein ParA [Syntrophus sp. (in: bacteria)]|nr:MAG: chromosome partitioning protein ParA [Syntrophus sp. GWC2_56_31]HBB17933.1 chromosome partitioning protein ParA [Syntrophus sp. (in: bacteria)]